MSVSEIKTKITNMNLPGGRHCLFLFIDSILLENIPRLLGESLLEERVSGNDRSVALILWNDAVLALHRFEL